MITKGFGGRPPMCDTATCHHLEVQHRLADCWSAPSLTSSKFENKNKKQLENWFSPGFISVDLNKKQSRSTYPSYTCL